jgi:hypothetical protein
MTPALAAFERPRLDYVSDRVPHLRDVYAGYELEPKTFKPLPVGEPIGWVLHLPYETNPLPMNGSHGHWRSSAAKKREARETAFLLTRGSIPRQERIRVRLDWEVLTRGDRDEDNLGVFFKALVDGLRDWQPKWSKKSGLPKPPLLPNLVPTDTREYVLREHPRINYASKADRPPGVKPHFRLLIWPAGPDSTSSGYFE